MQQNIQERFYSSLVFCTFATNQYFLSLDKCFPNPHMIPRNRRPTFASRVRRNIVEVIVRKFSFSPCETLDLPENRVTFCSPESTPDAGIFFFWWSPKSPKQHFFHVVLQTCARSCTIIPSDTSLTCSSVLCTFVS